VPTDLWIYGSFLSVLYLLVAVSAHVNWFPVHLISFRVEILDRELFREAVTKVDSEGPRMGGISE